MASLFSLLPSSINVLRRLAGRAASGAPLGGGVGGGGREREARGAAERKLLGRRAVRGEAEEGREEGGREEGREEGGEEDEEEEESKYGLKCLERTLRHNIRYTHI